MDNDDIVIFKIGTHIFKIQQTQEDSVWSGNFKMSKIFNRTLPRYINISKKYRIDNTRGFLTLGTIQIFENKIIVFISYNTHEGAVNQQTVYKKNKQRFYDITECLVAELELEDLIG